MAPDSGTPPAPHYCTAPPDPCDGRQGCPVWPACLFAEGDDAGHECTLTADIAALGGLAAGALLFLAVAMLLLPLFT